MIAAAVQYGAVVRYEEEAALCGEIARERRSARGVQMVGRLVEERKPFGREQDGKLQFRAFAARQRSDRAEQALFGKSQQTRLPQDLPLRRIVEISCGKVIPACGFIGDRKRETKKSAFRGNAPLSCDLPCEELEKGTLPHAVPADDPEFPIGIEVKGQIFKNGREPARVGICDMIELNIRHCVASVKKFREKIPRKRRGIPPLISRKAHRSCPSEYGTGKAVQETLAERSKTQRIILLNGSYLRRSGITSLRTRSS